MGLGRPTGALLLHFQHNSHALMCGEQCAKRAPVLGPRGQASA